MAVLNRNPAETSTQQALQRTHQPRTTYHHPHRHHIHDQHTRRRPGPVNVATGSRISLAQQPSTSVTSDRRTLKSSTTVFSSSSSSSHSLPAVLVSLSGGILLAAAAMHVCGPDQPQLVTSAVSVVDSLKEFGPADILPQSFGPTRPLWAALIQHSHETVPTTASAASLTGLATAAARCLHLPTISSHGGNGVVGGTLASSLLLDIHGIAEHATASMRSAVDGICDGYNRWLQESPLTCKIVTGNIFTVAGDMLAQLGLAGGCHGAEVENARPSSKASGSRSNVDLMRTGRLCLETSAFGTPLAHWWFNLLDSRIMPDNPHCATAVLTKMLADQVLFAPLGLLMFFTVMKCLEGRSRDLQNTLRTSYAKTLLGGYLLWPLAGILNFALLPNEYRLLFNNCINIFWICFLSIMSSCDDNAEGVQPSAPPGGVGALSLSASVQPSPSGTIATLSIESPAVPVLPATAVPCVATGIANDLAKAAVAAAANSAAVGDRPAFGCVAGLAVAIIRASLESYGSLQQHPDPVPQPQLVTTGLYEQPLLGLAC